MRILCAPDSFKECLAAAEVAAAMAAGVKAAGAEPDRCPIADGGEGTLDALLAARGGHVHAVAVTGPLGEQRSARWAALADGRTAVVELAEASGLALIPKSQRDPARTSTFGTGEVIRAAIEHGCREVILCIGGSGTVDGGAGIAQALGARFLNTSGKILTDPITGGTLTEIARIEPPPSPLNARIRIACDVTNPLCGEHGAAAVYGPQKGATPAQVALLDAGLAHLAALLDVDPQTPGFGAAGGAAVCPVALFRAELQRGVEIVLEAVNFNERCRRCDLVLTGEGQLDSQSLSGKATMGVAAAAARHGVSTIAIVGRLGPGAEHCVDPSRPGSLMRRISLAERFGDDRAMCNAAALIEQIAAEIVRGT